MASSLKNQILSSFNIRGYTLRSEASKYLLSVLEPLEASSRTELIKKTVEYLQTQSLKSSLIEKSVLTEAVQSFESIENNEDIHLNFISAFDLPAYSYHNDTEKFILRNALQKRNTNCIYGNADSKADIYVERYNMIHQRTLRHKLFAQPAIVTKAKNDQQFTLRSIEFLLGSSAKQTNLIVLGMLTQLKEGQFYLEDPTGAVKIDLTNASYKDGLFTENSIILAEGYCEEGILHATAIGYPPTEPASVTLSYFPYFDSLPGTRTTSFRLSEKLKTIEKRNAHSMFIFLSDVWLDKLKIMLKLQVFFNGYAQFPPTCFVFIGNFLSPANVGGNGKKLKECFDKLGNMISEYPNLVAKSTFVFVPGPDDHGLSHILPRPPIPEVFLQEFRKKVPHAIFTTNPCRFQYCSQEIVIFRQDIVSKMCRNAVYMPWQQEGEVDIPTSFVKTIIANSHLMPLPMTVAPIYWEYDHAFWLYPLPDLVVCADKCDAYTIANTGSIFCNPGSLPLNNFSFKVYLPNGKLLEDSVITDDHLH